MKYKNPVLRGMYPDPSVCRAGDRYYMVCSTFQYFPAVPVFESDDMVNWKHVGDCITRKSQLDLNEAGVSGGIYAPTIRFNNGRFYMVTTNASVNKNFYVYTDDIYGEWSEPIFVEQDGIDPTLYFEDGRTYFMSNSGDSEGACIKMCEIDVESGRIISEPWALWRGTGGRFMEAPHLYKIGEFYYVLDAEGGTEYGHMVNYARGKSMHGPFEPCPSNPVLTNRNLGGYILQGAGHGDIIEDKNGKWWFMHLGFRQSGMWMTYHHLGRECCLVPVEWKDGWFSIGDGTSRLEYDLPDRTFAPQILSYKKNVRSITENGEWCFMREYAKENYEFSADSVKIKAKKDDLFCGGYPSFAAIRQNEFRMNISCAVNTVCEEAGITVFMDEKHHYDLFADKSGRAVLRLTIGPVTKEMKSAEINGDKVTLSVRAQEYGYDFYVVVNGNEINLGYADSKYLSSEVAGGFTGVMLGLYAVDGSGATAEFIGLSVEHSEE